MSTISNPTTLPVQVFLDALPLVRSFVRGVGDRYPEAHYQVVGEHRTAAAAGAEPTLLATCGASADPHPVFAHPDFAVRYPAGEDDATLAARDARHRARCLAALSPEVCAAFAALEAKSYAPGATPCVPGIATTTLWDDTYLPQVLPGTRLARIQAENDQRAAARTAPLSATEIAAMHAEWDAVPKTIARLGARSLLTARATAGQRPSTARNQNMGT